MFDKIKNGLNDPRTKEAAKTIATLVVTGLVVRLAGTIIVEGSKAVLKKLSDNIS